MLQKHIHPHPRHRNNNRTKALGIWSQGIGIHSSDDISIPLSGKRKYLLQYRDRRIQTDIYIKTIPFIFRSAYLQINPGDSFLSSENSAVYLDIETTGLDRHFNDITTIALYNGHEIKTYVQGQNLNDFIEDIQRYKVIVTYNGKCFDVPFIENYFNIRLDHAQIDLRYVLYSLGLRGGLKSVERQLGMNRGDLSEIDGFFAVLLWDDYQKTGDPKALDTLLAYNVQDTITSGKFDGNRIQHEIKRHALL